MCGDILATVGLVLDIIGVFFIWAFALGKPLSVPNSSGKEVPLSLGTDADRAEWKKALSNLGLPLILIGFVLQIIALWV